MKDWQLQQMINLPLEVKIEKSKLRVREWIEHWGEDKVYISFSGGKDSTVLLHLVRQICPVPAVFVDTGLEYPELKQFVKSFNNVEIIRPKKTFKQIIEQYGYPVISKEQAHYIEQVRRTNSKKILEKRLAEKGPYNISKKWRFLIDAPFKISAKCCDYLKKSPAKEYFKNTGRVPFIGTMVTDSDLRLNSYIRYGCNAFDLAVPQSRPLSFWTEQDVLQYILQNNLTIAPVYGDIVKNEAGLLTTTGEKRTGCMFCMFGAHIERSPNRFERMKVTHPEIYDYCINRLKIGEILDYIRVKY